MFRQNKPNVEAVLCSTVARLACVPALSRGAAMSSSFNMCHSTDIVLGGKIVNGTLGGECSCAVQGTALLVCP